MKIFYISIIVASLTSCSIVSKNKLDGFAKLEGWKKAADVVHAQHDGQVKAAYESAESAVADVIGIKKQQATAVSDRWLPIGTVDGSLDDLEATSSGLQAKVALALADKPTFTKPAPAASEAEIITVILDAIRKAAVEGRKGEAKELNTRLDTYLWKKW